MTRPYPERNPFPYQGTLSIEGTTESDDPAGTLTVPLDPIVRTADLTRSFLARFQPVKRGQGLAVVLSGDHGAGKTHTIYFIRDQVASGKLAPKKSGDRSGLSSVEVVPKPMQLYAKAEGPSFLEVCQRLLKDVDFDAMREMGRKFLAVTAAHQLGEELAERSDRESELNQLRNLAGRQGEAETGQEAPVTKQALRQAAAEVLRQDPGKVDRLFSQLAVEPGKVQELLAAAVGEAAGNVSDDFQRAVSFLSGRSELAQAAYNWLTGRKVTHSELKSLGVSGPIASADDGKWAIQLLATLFRETGRPVILYIDQYERLVLDRDSAVATKNKGHLQSLVEVVSRENGMLLLAGSYEAWSALRVDLRGRFGYSVVEFPLLTQSETMQVVRLYLSPASEGGLLTDNALVEGEIYPFTPDAVRSILQFGSGNIRRVLQICAAAFDAASPSKSIIGVDLIENVLQGGSHLYFTRETVVAEIQNALTQHNARFRKDFAFEGIHADFAVLATDASPLALIQISEALFYLDEAQMALGHLNLVEKLQERRSPARFVLVVLGYVSREVIAKLSEAVHDLIVYRRDTFRSDFEKALERLPAVAESRTESLENRDALVADVRAALQAELKARDDANRALQTRLAALLVSQQEDRTAERRRSAREAWADERRKIEDQIREARSKRLDRSFDELEGLRDKAEKKRQFRGYGIAALYGVVVFGLIDAAVFRLRFFFEFVTTLILLFAVCVAASVALMWLWTQWRGNTGMRAPVASINDLTRAAMAFVSDSEFNAVGIRNLLRSSHPYYRYAGAFGAEATRDQSTLIRALLAEPSAIVRTAIAKKIGEGPKVGIPEVERLISSTKEAAYIFELGAPHAPGDIAHLTAAMQTLEVICGAPVTAKNSSLAQLLAAEVRSTDSNNSLAHSLAQAFESGSDPVVPRDAQGLSEPRVQEALKELSPFEEGGLGTLDALRNIQLIDQLYIFFRQVQSLLDRDLLFVPTPSSEKKLPI